MTRIIAGVAAAFALAFGFAAQAAPVDTGHIVAELVAQRQGVAPGQTVYVALRQKIDKGWHTYWRNPGDSGEATQIAWTLPAGWKAGDIVWATPHRMPVGPLLNYGYTGEVFLPVPITAPSNARVGQTVQLKAAVAFLVCEEICIPENAALQISLPVVAASSASDPRSGALVDRALAEAPKPANLAATFEKRTGGVALAITGTALKGADVAKAYFFPFDGTVIDHAKPQKIERGPDGLTLTLPPGYAFEKGPAPKTLAGVLSLGDKGYEVSARPGPAAKGAAGLGPPPAAAADSTDIGLPLAAVFALLGGLILNLMPCVFPILAMKAASLAGHAHGGEARRQGLAFGAGVLATFLLLAGAMIGLQAAGASIGWGFQLQSPPVVAVLALLMLAVALNLSGVFEIGASLQGVGSGAAARGGLSGAFFTGALAVVVAAPCTAPFMAPALGWALTQDPLSALTVFAALGIGFAAPFVAVAFVPGLLARLPRPGAWMVTFRKVLAFPMYAAAAWLIWVLTIQAGEMGLARVLAAAVILALGAWLAGLAQERRAQGGRSAMAAVAALVLVIAASIGAVWPPYAQAEDSGSSETAVVPYEAYSPERLAALRAEGRPVFVNYTAGWCVTCLLNERSSLSQRGVAEALKRTNTAYLKADWTKKDAVIAADLASHGRAGVPLYLVYGKNGGDPEVLPQILTEGMVVKALERAAAT